MPRRRKNSFLVIDVFAVVAYGEAKGKTRLVTVFCGRSRVLAVEAVVAYGEAKGKTRLVTVFCGRSRVLAVEAVVTYGETKGKTRLVTKKRVCDVILASR